MLTTVPNSSWRPFNGPLFAASHRQARVILNGLFTWLVDAGYLRGNPMALLRQRAKRSAPRAPTSMPCWHGAVNCLTSTRTTLRKCCAKRSGTTGSAGNCAAVQRQRQKVARSPLCGNCSAMAAPGTCVAG
ncbi:Hypothetical protein RBRH_04264 (plasmid) [Mycetohabitans rhizoxinica HKI 454]|uniref:Uncharacterized protein n=1 Tax=Mycetohabitans rhizoxinica (strain DSM 19002 / CIP 109453 / HKI 454) TaxID=882378 RepID=E5AUU6_MYCRK|nr:Hypothetical protein RBRH_04264 [Mycetohabitans rhizoxinica HKI 454]